MSVVVGLVVWAFSSSAAAADVYLSHYVTSDGTGGVIAIGGDGPITWERCTDVCVAHDDGDANDQTMVVADDPVGSVFKATRGGVTVASASWLGRVAATSSAEL